MDTKLNQLIINELTKEQYDEINPNDNELYFVEDKSYNMPIGTIFPVLANEGYVPEGCLPCDGAEYESVQFSAFYSNYIASGLLKSCSYEEYEQNIINYGQCAMFGDNIDTFRVPLIKDGTIIQQAMTDVEIGKAYNAGLPNIYGTFRYREMSGDPTQIIDDPTGAFSTSVQTETSITQVSSGTSGYAASKVILDASNYNSIYGNSDTVQMNAVSVRYFVVIADGAFNESQFNWGEYFGGLMGKANDDLSNCTKPYIIEASDESLYPTWYRIYSDGWCEQGGIVTAGASNTGAQVLLAKELSENYSLRIYVLGESDTFNTAGTWVKSRAITNSSFYISSGYTGASSTAYTAYKCSWEAKGYLK